jgi:hypothetical protein
MSYEPSHRKPPRQERWPNATPGEGWPAYQHGDGEQSWAPASAGVLAGGGNGYAGHNGYRDAWGGRATTAEYGWDSRGTAQYGAPAQYAKLAQYGAPAQYAELASGSWPAGNGYGGATTAWPATGDGYTDGFDGAADGYAAGYAAPAQEYGYAQDYGQAAEYGQAGEYYQAGSDWDGYTQPGHEFGTSGYLEQDEYPALDAAASSVLVAPDTVGEWWRQPEPDEVPGQRGPVVGMVIGVLAAAVAIGVATFAAAFVRPQSAPVSAVGGAFIDRIPATLKGHLMAHFGAHSQTVLLLGTAGLIAIVLGLMARRNVSAGVAGIAAFGLLGAFIAVTRPASHASDVIPSAIGGLAGIMALLWLARASAPLRPAYGGPARSASWPGGAGRGEAGPGGAGRGGAGRGGAGRAAARRGGAGRRAR